MTLNEVWFGLFVLIIAGYLILDGFDMGVGIVHLIVAKTDHERRIVLNSIGPVWDGNGVWLVLGGGVLFAAFPLVYASLFSGFYIPFFFVLLVIILRTASIEFRSKRPGPRWRRTWDIVFSLSSLGLAFLLGVAFGNILNGVALDQNGDINESLIDLLSPYALLVGVTAVAMFGLHGLFYLAMKTEGELENRVRRLVPRAGLIFFVLATAAVLVTELTDEEIRERYLDDIWPIVFPAAALGALIYGYFMVRAGRDFRAFVASSAMIALLLISGAAGLYPNLLISSIDEKYNLTITNSASQSNTLTVMLVVAIIGMPLVLLYTAGVYYFFRGKVSLEPESY
jgi:cytochrome d ubiquinol oxidase subunit II